MEVRERLEQELYDAVRRLRHLGEAVVLEQCVQPVGGSASLTDQLDAIEVLEGRERLFATRGRVAQRVAGLADALDRLRDGRYGVCEDCEGPIGPARLAAIPEARTCIGCQGRWERRAREEVLAKRPSFEMADGE